MKIRRDFSAKPYNRCLSCQHLGARCDGPRTSAMELDRWCEYMRDMKQLFGLTNEYIAEVSGYSVKTIDRVMSQSCGGQDIMRETARKIENAVMGSSNQYPCFLAFEESAPDAAQAMRELERALADNQDYRTVLDGIHTSYKAEMQTIRDEAKGKVDYLLEQVERLRGEIDYLRLENDRKARVIDKLLEYEA